MSVFTSPQLASAVRTFTLTVVVGTALIGCLWIGVRWSVRAAKPGVTAAGGVERRAEADPPPGDPASMGRGAESVPVEALNAAAAARASNSVLLIGSVVIPAIGILLAVLQYRRIDELEVLNEQLTGLQLSEFAEPLEIPAYRSAPLRTIYRVLEETQETILRKIHKLKAERRRGFQVLGHMTDGVIAVSPDRRVLLVNRAAWTLLGIKREKAFLGRPCAEVVRVPQILSLVDKVLGGAHAEMVEFDLPGDRELSLRVQAVELPGEGDPGVLVTIRDETQVKQLEKMRREFIANVSHELKTPLAAIRGYAETLQLGAIHDPETCPHFLEQINVQSSRLESLINDMLQLARAQTGNQHLTLGHVTLQPVLRESLSSYAPVAQAREITLQHEPVAATAGVLADREALVTIVNNLLGNAVRYTPEGGHVALEVRDEQDRWAITVRDDGIGIPEEDQRRIFERFYRVEKARDATRGGTGLGLAIVKNLVLALDGEIRLHSRPGEGSTFKVLLPKSVSPSRDSAARQVT